MKVFFAKDDFWLKIVETSNDGFLAISKKTNASHYFYYKHELRRDECWSQYGKTLKQRMLNFLKKNDPFEDP